jgi:hypothetical protein
MSSIEDAMTQDDSSSSSEQGNPRKNGLNLDLLFRPATVVSFPVKQAFQK